MGCAQSKHKVHLAFARSGLFCVVLFKASFIWFGLLREPGVVLNPSIKSTLHSQGPDFFVFSAY